MFKWLQGLGIAKEGKRNINNLMELTEEATQKLMDGYAIGVLLKSLLKHRLEEEKFKKIEALKENSTPAIRLYNWGILSEVLKQLGLTI